MPVYEIVEVESDEGCAELRCGDQAAYGLALPDALEEMRWELEKRRAQAKLGFPAANGRSAPRRAPALEREA